MWLLIILVMIKRRISIQYYIIFTHPQDEYHIIFNLTQDQYDIIFTHSQFLTAASSKVRVNRVALSPSPIAVCSLEVFEFITITGIDNNLVQIAIN